MSKGKRPSNHDGEGEPLEQRMSSEQVRKFCALSTDAENLLRMAMDNLNLSARAHDRTLDRKLWR